MRRVDLHPFQQARLNDAHVLVDDVIVRLGCGGCGRGRAGAGRGGVPERRGSTRRWSFVDLSVQVGKWVWIAPSWAQFFSHRFRINGLLACRTGVFHPHRTDFVVHLRINRVMAADEAVLVGRSIGGALFRTRWVGW